MELDMKKWVNNASHYLSKVERKTLLWTNENPFSQFAAQTLLTQGELEDYDIVEIESYIYITNSSNRQTTIPITVHMNETGCMQSGAFGGSNYASGVFWFATRKVTPSSSGIEFDNAYGGYPNNNWTMRNDMCIPYRIYGIKIGSGTEDVEGRGTSDYNLLIHKPSINGVTLVEGLSSDDLNIGDTSHEEMSQAEFDILPEVEKDDGTVYFITDGISKNVFLDDNTPIGMIAPYGGTVDPSYWLICDGRAVSRTAYSELFLVIGTTYGAGDGSTTFNIPDLRGNVAVGASATYDLGDSGGEDTHTLVENELPLIDGHLAWHGQEHGTHVYHVYDHFYGTRVASQYQTTGATAGAESWADVGYKFGGNLPHNNMQPYVVTNYIIKAKTALSENQSQLDFFYPVGSYYETSDTTFDPNIRWGGTWEKVEEGKFLQATTNNNKVGNEVAAGLPNITGVAHANTTYSGSPYSGGSFSGALYAESMSGTQYYLNGRAAGSGWSDIGINASLSNSIYGNSTTVQPPAILVVIWHRVA